jgi:hypothetical protein
MTGGFTDSELKYTIWTISYLSLGEPLLFKCDIGVRHTARGKNCHTLLDRHLSTLSIDALYFYVRHNKAGLGKMRPFGYNTGLYFFETYSR